MELLPPKRQKSESTVLPRNMIIAATLALASLVAASGAGTLLERLPYRVAAPYATALAICCFVIAAVMPFILAGNAISALPRRYSLRTLIFLMFVVPTLLAAIWFWGLPVFLLWLMPKSFTAAVVIGIANGVGFMLIGVLWQWWWAAHIARRHKQPR